MDSTKQSHIGEIVKILMGAAHIAPIKQDLQDAMNELTSERLDRAWSGFAFNETYKRSQENAERLFTKIDSFPEEYRRTAIDYAEEFDSMKFIIRDDAYLKGILDGIEIQMCLQGAGERGEAQ
ncbi:MAG: hypothetical protein AB9903_34290 [Vulcanimicrobiota bacterium]